MIFDDHDVHDDWNTSAAGRADCAAGLVGERIRSGLASYWVYQHLGNLAPDEIAADPLYAKVVAAEAPPTCCASSAGVADDALGTDRRQAGIRWSVRRDFGNAGWW